MNEVVVTRQQMTAESIPLMEPSGGSGYIDSETGS